MEEIRNINHWFEIFFGLSIVFHLFTDYTKPGEHEPVKDLLLIMKKYIYSDFIYDLIPIIPIPHLFLYFGKEPQYTYLVKIIRINRGIKAFNIMVLL